MHVLCAPQNPCLPDTVSIRWRMSIAWKCKQIRKQSEATFSNLTWVRTKVCYKKYDESDEAAESVGKIGRRL